jgi:molybdate transport system substrate-binding protein
LSANPPERTGRSIVRSRLMVAAGCLAALSMTLAACGHQRPSATTQKATATVPVTTATAGTTASSPAAAATATTATAAAAGTTATTAAATAVTASVSVTASAPATATASATATATAKNVASTVAEITVAAASDLRPAFEELGAAFTAQTRTKVTFSFGSSGQLRQQIINGAPFDLFASADVAYVDEVIKSGRGVAATKADYAFGRIVLWSPPGIALPAQIKDLTKPDYRRVAIANPDHAPYGLAAKQALEAAGIYDELKGRLVYGENISDTFQIATSGNAEVGIVALSLATANGGTYTLIPAELHKPLEQALVVTSTGAQGGAATAFAAFISSPTGRAVMTRYGFTLPSDKISGQAIGP